MPRNATGSPSHGATPGDGPPLPEIEQRIVARRERIAALPDDGPETAIALLELAWELWTTDREEAEQLTIRGVEMAARHGSQRGIAYGKLNQGALYWQSDIDQGRQDLLDACQWFETHGDPIGEGHARMFLGLIYWTFGDFQSGFGNVRQALEAYEAVDHTDGMAWAHSVLGNFYYDLRDARAMRENFHRSYRLFRKSGNVLGQGRAVNGLGNACRFLGRHDQAIAYYKKSLDILGCIGHDMSRSRALNDLGLLYRELGDFEESLRYHRESLAVRKRLDYAPGMTTTLLDLGDLHLEQKRFDDAREAALEALALAEKGNARPKVSRARAQLAAVYEATGELERALHHQKALYAVDREVFHEDAEKKLANLQKTWAAERSRKEAEIYRLRNVDLKEKNDQLETTLRQLNAAQAQLVQSGKMAALGSLVAGLVHEINTPVGAIKSGSDVARRIVTRLQGNGNGGDPEARKALELLAGNFGTMDAAIDRIIALVDSLKQFTRLDEARLLKTDVHACLENTLTLIAHELKDGPRVERDFDSRIPPLYLYGADMNQVLMNILLNAVEATPVDGVIRLETHLDAEVVRIAIHDTGRGIAADRIEALFEPGFSDSRARIKMRTGLYTSQAIVARHEGRIEVDSTPGRGSIFTIVLPRSLAERPTSQP